MNHNNSFSVEKFLKERKSEIEELYSPIDVGEVAKIINVPNWTTVDCMVCADNALYYPLKDEDPQKKLERLTGFFFSTLQPTKEGLIYFHLLSSWSGIEENIDAIFRWENYNKNWYVLIPKKKLKELVGRSPAEDVIYTDQTDQEYGIKKQHGTVALAPFVKAALDSKYASGFIDQYLGEFMQSVLDDVYPKKGKKKGA